MSEPCPRDDGPVTQQLTSCTLLYDLTQHRIDVLDEHGELRLRLWSLPDTPGGFSLTEPDHSIEVHNPNAVNFHPMHDNYEDHQALYG